MTALSTAFRVAVQFGSLALLARLIPPGEFGIVALAMPAVMVAISLSQFGLAHAIVQRTHVTHRLATSLFWANAALAGIFAIVLIVLSPFAAGFYGEPRVGPVFLALSASVFFGGLLSPFTGILRRQMRFKMVESASSLSDFVAAALAIGSALLGASYWAVVIQNVTTQLLALVSLAIASRWLPSRPQLNRSGWLEARSALAFGSYLSTFGLVTQLSHSMATVIVGRSFGAELAAVYFRGWTLSNFPGNRLATPMGGVFVPALSRLLDDKAAFEALFTNIVRRLALVMMPIGIGFCSSADIVTTVLLGDRWAETAQVLTWLGVLSLQVPLASSLNWVMVASGAVRKLMTYGFVAAAMILLALVLGSRWSLVVMTAIYALSGIFVRLPTLAAFAVSGTPLGWGAILRSFGIEIVLAGVVLLLTIGVRHAIPSSSILVHAGAVVLVIGTSYGLRAALDPQLRNFVRGIFPRAARLG